MNKMKPKYIVYDLKSELNVERFKRKALEKDYIEGRLNFPPFFENCISLITRKDPYSQVTIDKNHLYLHLDSSGNFPKIKELIKNFELE